MKAIRNHLRQFDKWRRRGMQNLEPLLYKIPNNTTHNNSQLLPKEDVKSILIIRNNKRIGNMYFLIPFVRQVRESYPNAHITLMLSQPWQGDVFANLGINDIVYSQFSFKGAIHCWNTIRTLKKTVFDLIVTPYSSAEDALMVASLSAKNKVGPANPHRQIAYSHTFTKNDNRQHAALNCLYLLSCLGNDLTNPISHHIELDDKELAAGKAAFKATYNGTNKVIAYFRGARGSKQLSNEAWQSILDRFELSSDSPVTWLEILSPDITSPLNPDTLTYSNRNMRILASYLKNVDGFICCDTGPLHLADAADVCCYGLYNETNPAIFGVLGEKSVNIMNFEQTDEGAAPLELILSTN
ncbi:lipopolysaccharide heptosyltransferase family protein [Vibrio hangzhouensis]|nr:lipopolysaccharide heptosyltransferase family protein [Vibrio hangzhouensis]